FFFSSRRRHTRSDRDWSSDVCSSDLHSHSQSSRMPSLSESALLGFEWVTSFSKAVLRPSPSGSMVESPSRKNAWLLGWFVSVYRSEERRVGKEGRSRGCGEQDKKKTG